MKKTKKPLLKPDSRREPSPESSPQDTAGSAGPVTIRTAVAIVAALIILCAIVWGVSHQTRGTPVVYFFYGQECPHCHEVLPFVESMEQKYPEVEFRMLEVWHNDTNRAHQTLLNTMVGQGNSGVPEIIIGNQSLLGTDAIEQELEPDILLQRGNLTGASQVAAIPVTGSLDTPNTTLAAVYFYGNGCSHCEKVEPIIDEMAARYPELRIERLEINDNATNRARFLATIQHYGRGGGIPTFVIGDTFLTTDTEVTTDRIEEAILAEKQRIASASAGTPAVPVPVVSPVPVPSATVDAMYFYGARCSHCESIRPLILNISSRYPDLNLTWLEVDDNATNRELLIAMSSRYSVPNPGTPSIFIGNQVLVGEGDVTERFESAILSERQRIASGTPLIQPKVNTTSIPEPTSFNPLMVVFGALVDSTNPCGLSVLVFLLISMVAAGERRRILLAGAVYIAAMFLFHLFVGIGLFSAFSLSGLAKPFSIIGGLLALVLGLITLADVIRNRETYLLSIPESGKGMLGTYIRRATLPGAFILGILAGIFGFTCTGGIYISILGLMGRQMTFMAGLPWLILYNVIYVLPLAILTLLVAYGISPERADRWRTENKRAIRVVIGVILVALGLVILSGWLG